MKKLNKNVSTNKEAEVERHFRNLRGAFEALREVKKSILDYHAPWLMNDKKIRLDSAVHSIARMIRLAPKLLLKLLTQKRLRYNDTQFLNALRFIALFHSKEDFRKVAQDAYKAFPKPAGYLPPNFQASPFRSAQAGHYSYGY